MKEVRTIHVCWERHDLNKEIIEKLNAPDHFGLYQIYGDHPVYGENKLLYIGKANDLKFSQRLTNRWEFVETILRPTRLHIGRLYYSDDCNNENWYKYIDIAERILIKAHCPAYNSKEIKGLLKTQDENFIVMNWDDYGALLTEVSSLRLSYEFWDIEKNGLIKQEP